MKKSRTIIFTLMVMVTTACTPVIDELRVNDANHNNVYEHNEALTVEADVTVKGSTGTPIVYTRPHLPADTAFQRVGQLTNKTLIGHVDGHDQYRYSGPLSLNYGAYDVRVSVPYISFLVTQYVSKQTSLLVDAPDSCFGFDGGSMGFTLGKVTLSNNSELPDSVPLGRKLFNWPEDAGGHASLSFDITTQHFPSPPQETRYWYIDFISPDLSNIPAWQQSQGMTFRVSTQAGHLYAQPIIYIENQDPHAPVDPESAQFLFYPISTAAMGGASVWNVVQWHSTPNLPAGVRQRIHIRIYGDANATTLNNDRTVFLDGVCPVPPGIIPPGGDVVAPVTNPIQ